MVSKYVFASLLALALIGGTVYASQGAVSDSLRNGAKHLKDRVVLVATEKKSVPDDKTGRGESGSISVATTPTTEVNGSVQEERDRSGDDKSTGLEEESKDGEDEDGDDADEDGDDHLPASTGVVTQPAQATNQTPTPTSAPKPQGYTMAQVQAANSASKCWSVVSGNVYDLTSWIGQHPGGASAIKAMCGVDATSVFQGQHGGQARPASELAGFKIGVLL
jgi:cytochrome b involved in lipid metabolism